MEGTGYPRAGRRTTSTTSRRTTSTSSARRRCRWRPITPTRSSRPSRCRAAMPPSAPATAARPARTARTPAASSACTGSTRSRCSSTRRSRSPTPSTSASSAGSSAWLDALELPYRVIDVASGDLGPLGDPQVRLRGVDPDAGQVSRGLVGVQLHRVPELAASTSAYAVRTGTAPAATLNGTLCAMTRTIIALLENGQQEDGSVRLPAALHPLLGEVLRPLAVTLEAPADRARRRRHAGRRRERHDRGRTLRGARRA